MKNLFKHFIAIYILVLILTINISLTMAQNKTVYNSVYIEALGNAGIYSLNYDRILSQNIGVRFGAGFLPIIDVLTIPATINLFIGNGSSKLELGAGILILSQTRDNRHGLFRDNNFITALIGYRYQQPEGGFLFRIGFTPLFSQKEFFPWGGFSVGTSF